MPSILGLATTNAPHCIPQDRYAAFMAEVLELSSREALYLKAMCDRSAIKQRFTVLDDFKQPLEGRIFATDNFKEITPSSLARNDLYKKHAPHLAELAAQAALADWGGKAHDISHIIFVSCTGMMAPGIEFLLIQKLGLKSSTQRYGLNFMGCFGAFRALALASALAQQDEKNRILIVSVELCSLHLQGVKTGAASIANLLFSDGAAAAIVGSTPGQEERVLWTIEYSASHGFDDCIDDMTWELSNNGFIMNLSLAVPSRIKNYINQWSKKVLGTLSAQDCSWAIHPGGKAIVEGIEAACDLRKVQTRASWEVLENYGNMSSATFLFVLNRLRQLQDSFEHVVGFGFGPGLSLEGIRLRKGTYEK